MTASHTFRALTCVDLGFFFLVKALSWINNLSCWLG